VKRNVIALAREDSPKSAIHALCDDVTRILIFEISSVKESKSHLGHYKQPLSHHGQHFGHADI
jgi:hypothetical protein